MSTSPDALVTTLSQWLARHVNDHELRAAAESVDVDALPPDLAEAVEELRAELRDPDGHPGELQMLVRETLEALALGA